MSIEAKLNSKYAELCTELGHLQFKKVRIEAEISALIQKIEKLNELQPELLKALEGSSTSKD